MRWRWMNFTLYNVPNDLYVFRNTLWNYPRMIRKSKTGSRVPAWTWDLYEVTYAEFAATWGARPENDPRPRPVFEERLRAAIPVVNKPGGVDPEVFCAALRLGGWEAARSLHSQLRPTVGANFPASLTK